MDFIDEWAFDARFYFMSTEYRLWEFVHSSENPMPITHADHLRAKELLLNCVPDWLKSALGDMTAHQIWTFLTVRLPSMTRELREDYRHLQTLSRPGIVPRIQLMEECLQSQANDIRRLRHLLHFYGQVISATMDHLVAIETVGDDEESG